MWTCRRITTLILLLFSDFLLLCSQTKWIGRDPRTDPLDNPQTAWQWLNPLPQGNTLNDVRALDSLTAIAVGKYGTVVRTNNGGDSWEVRHYAGGVDKNLRALFFPTSTFGFIVGDNGVILHTQNGGDNWETQSSGTERTLRGIFFSDVNNGVAVGDSGIVLRTTNGGGVWSRKTSGVTRQLNGVFFPTPTSGVVVGDSVVLRTSDGGEHWLFQASLAGGTSVWFTSSQKGFATFPFQILMTTNGGQTWSVVFTNSGNAPAPINKIAFQNSMVGVAVGGVYHPPYFNHQIYRTSDGGLNWSTLIQSVEYSSMSQLLSSITMVEGNLALAVGAYGRIRLSTDSGLVWAEAGAGMRYPITKVVFSSAAKGWGYVDAHLDNQHYGGSVHTTDGGNSWQFTEWGGTAFGIDAHFVDPLNGVEVDGNQSNCSILKTTNGGDSWTQVYRTRIDSLMNSAFMINPNTIVAVGKIRILRTTDGGTSWSSQANSTTLCSVSFGSQSVGVAVGAAGAIVRTTNGGISWQTPSSPTPDTLFGVTHLGSSTAIAVGKNGNVIRTTNAGLTWASVTSGTTLNLRSVSAAGSLFVTACGDSGLILGSTNAGVTWFRVNCPTRNRLNSIQFVPYGTGFVPYVTGYVGYAVGEGGAILVCAIPPLVPRTWLWTGAVDSSWNNASNWTPPGVPLPGDSVIIGSSTINPVIYQPQEQIIIGALNILSGGILTITPALARFVVLADVNVHGTLALRPPAVTGIVVGGNWTIRPDLSSDLGFVPASSTVFFTGTGTFERNFYNLTIDSASVMSITANALVSNQAGLMHDVNLTAADTLSFSLAAPQALVGLGKVSRGTIQRAIQPILAARYRFKGDSADSRIPRSGLYSPAVTVTTQQAHYRFESESTYVRFYGSGTYPSSVTVTTYPDTTPSSFGRLGVIVPSTVDVNSHTIRGDSLHISNRRWVIVRPPPTGRPLDVFSLDSLAVQRVYAISSGGDTDFTAHLTLRYDPSEVPVGVPEDSLKLFYLITPPTVSLLSGWNLISNPVIATNDSVQHLFPSAAFPYAFKFAGATGYQQDYTMENGVGFWEKFPSAGVWSFSDSTRQSDSIAVMPGWNIMGSVSDIVDTATQITTPYVNLAASHWYGYSGGYVIVTTIEPGKGYWKKANGNGKFYFGASGPKPARAFSQTGTSVLDAMNSVTIAEAGVGAQTLYFGTEVGNIPAALYEMPPKPPAGAFDARFESAEGGLMLSMHPAHLDNAIELPIVIQSDFYPLTVSWKIKGNTGYTLNDGVGGKLFAEKSLTGEGSMKIPNPAAHRVVISVTGKEIPTEFSLQQNYPNPFNPTTTIKYQLPVESRVSLQIYNVLGQVVKTLVNEVQSPGYKQQDWNGTNSAGSSVGSGVCFYRMDAVSTGIQGRSFTQVKKLLILK